MPGPRSPGVTSPPRISQIRGSAKDRPERGNNDRGWGKKVCNQPPEHHCVLETRKDVRGAPKQVQHAPHLRVGHLRAAQVHLDLQSREPHCALIVDGYSPPLLTEVGGRQGWVRQVSPSHEIRVRWKGPVKRQERSLLRERGLFPLE